LASKFFSQLATVLGDSSGAQGKSMILDYLIFAEQISPREKGLEKKMAGENFFGGNKCNLIKGKINNIRNFNRFT